jgi:VanZ family protein
MPRRRLTTHLSLWLPPVAYMALIFYLSAQSNPLPELTKHVWDKLLHGFEYAVLAALLGRALLGEGLSAVTTVVAAVLLASAYGASDEYHQRFVPMRSSDVQDWMVDVFGSSLGACGCLYVASRRSSTP